MPPIPDQLTRDLLTQIHGDKMAFVPSDHSHESIVEFQATAKRIEWAKRYDYIHAAKFKRGGSGNLYGIALAVVVDGGLTLEGEQLLLEDPDERAF